MTKSKQPTKLAVRRAPAVPAAATAMRRGALYAADMINRLKDDQQFNDECDPETLNLEPKPQGAQHNVVWNYLQALQEAAGDKGVAGFCLLLSGYLAMATAGSTPIAGMREIAERY